MQAVKVILHLNIKSRNVLGANWLSKWGTLSMTKRVIYVAFLGPGQVQVFEKWSSSSKIEW